MTEQAVRDLDALAGVQPDGLRVLDAFVESFGASKLGALWQAWLDRFAQLVTARSTLASSSGRSTPPSALIRSSASARRRRSTSGSGLVHDMS